MRLHWPHWHLVSHVAATEQKQTVNANKLKRSGLQGKETSYGWLMWPHKVTHTHTHTSTHTYSFWIMQLVTSTRKTYYRQHSVPYDCVSSFVSDSFRILQSEASEIKFLRKRESCSFRSVVYKLGVHCYQVHWLLVLGIKTTYGWHWAWFCKRRVIYWQAEQISNVSVRQ